MRTVHETITCTSRSTRLEIFPIGDVHIGKRNCDEDGLRKQVGEILKRSKMKDRVVRVLLGGDILNAIIPADIRRFDFSELADWFISGDAQTTREMLNDMVVQEVVRAVSILKPISHLIVGAIEGNHCKSMRKRQNLNIHKLLCRKLDVLDLSDEAFIRLKIERSSGGSRCIKIYFRHGYGGGRTPGAEPNKLARMLNEWEDADVCLTGHTHSYCLLPPKPVLYLPSMDRLPTKMPIRHRFAANWGCWLLSHMLGDGSYESAACYESKPMMTVKVVFWPFWCANVDGKTVDMPKIELREYPIL